jgi:hypothetical protein
MRRGKTETVSVKLSGAVLPIVQAVAVGTGRTMSSAVAIMLADYLAIAEASAKRIAA